MWNCRVLASTFVVIGSVAVLGCQAKIGDESGRGSGAGPGPGNPGTNGPGVPDFTNQNPGDSTAPKASTFYANEPVVMRRLTRTEFDNSVRDLLGTNLRLGYSMPPEELVRGFDNNAAALTYPPVLAEKALTAAQQIAKRVVAGLNTFVPCAASADQACARQFITDFGKRAWRRPLSTGEVDDLVVVFEVGNKQSFERGIELVATSLFISAPFWYRVEFGDGQDVAGKANMVRPSSWEMASRLSYTLWNSTPDDALFAEAERDALKTPEQVRAQVERLLADQRAREAVANFNAQWLQIKRLDSIDKDPGAFPMWRTELRGVFRTELELFAERAAWNRPRGLEELFTSNVSFVDGQLAELYGVAAPGGAGFQEVTLDAGTRSGILTRMGILAYEGFVTTSPVKRGAYIRRRILCQEPPPPPPTVNNTPPPVTGTTTTRERLAQHSANAACRSCHQLIDPVGFGLERYDAIGQYRETENGSAIDDTGTVIQSDVGEFKGAVELGAKLAQSVQVQQCFAQHWFRFAYGRSPSATEAKAIEQIAGTVQATGGNYGDVLRALTETDQFLYRPKM